MPSRNLKIYQLDYTPELDLKKVPEDIGLLQINLGSLDGFDLAAIKLQTKLPIIVSCVRVQNGGLFDGQKQDLVLIYNQLLNIAPDFVEIEASLVEFVDITLIQPRTKLILVDVNLYKTPNYRGLRKIAKQMSSFKPYFYKFNYKLQTAIDQNNLLKFVENKNKKQRFIIQTTGDNSHTFSQELNRFGVGDSYLKTS